MRLLPHAQWRRSRSIYSVGHKTVYVRICPPSHYVLNHGVDDFHHILAYGIGGFHRGGLGIDSDDGLGIALAQVNPLVGEVYLDTVDIINLLLGIDTLDFGQDGIDISTGLEVDTVLGDEVRRICLAELTDGFALMGQMTQEECDTYQCVTAIMECRIDNSAIAFTSDDGSGLFHLGGDVDLTDSCGIVLTAILTGHITQCTG